MFNIQAKWLAFSIFIFSLVSAFLIVQFTKDDEPAATVVMESAVAANRVIAGALEDKTKSNVLELQVVVDKQVAETQIVKTYTEVLSQKKEKIQTAQTTSKQPSADSVNSDTTVSEIQITALWVFYCKTKPQAQSHPDCKEEVVK